VCVCTFFLSLSFPCPHSGGGRGEFNAVGGDIELDFTVQGTCATVEKKYLRLTSAPDPKTVRPEPVLKLAVDRYATHTSPPI